ncbi:MAG TPA: amidohydrolase, partial [Alphaproteobacteria bacterium]|nr:amidohydrolase [Alphaproteobacteria bacterium]
AEEAVAVLRETFGSTVVREASPVMGGEDFAQYHRTDEEIPVFMFWVGGTPQETLDSYRERGETPPSNHSPFFAPDAEASITLATEAMSLLALDYLAAPAAETGEDAE